MKIKDIASKYKIDSFDFEKELKLEDLHVFQCTINENTRFASTNPDSLGGYYWISNTNDSWRTYGIDGTLGSFKWRIKLEFYLR